MPLILLETSIKVPIELVFDLSRDIGLHLQSTAKTQERVVKGRSSGLVELGDCITWEAVHLGIRQQLTSCITSMTAPLHFRDEMEKGIFKKLCHNHYFDEEEQHTIMIDEFYFEAPAGCLGQFFNKVFLINYMRNFLLDRNAYLKEQAENIAHL